MSSSPTSSSSSEPLREPGPFDALGGLRCHVSVVLGTGSITVRQCLGLTKDAVIRLGQSAGEDLQLQVNGVPIARGEVAIIDTSTAIRLTELLPARGSRRA